MVTSCSTREYTWVCEFPKPKLFDNMRKRRGKCKWNTGVIVDFDTNRSVDEVSTYNDIRPFSFDERQRAKERKEMNNG